MKEVMVDCCGRPEGTFFYGSIFPSRLYPLSEYERIIKVGYEKDSPSMPVRPLGVGWEK